MKVGTLLIWCLSAERSVGEGGAESNEKQVGHNLIIKVLQICLAYRTSCIAPPQDGLLLSAFLLLL